MTWSYLVCSDKSSYSNYVLLPVRKASTLSDSEHLYQYVWRPAFIYIRKALFVHMVCANFGLNTHMACTNFSLNTHSVCTNFGLIVHTQVYSGKIVLHLLIIGMLGWNWDAWLSFGIHPNLLPSQTPTIHPYGFVWYINSSVPKRIFWMNISVSTVAVIALNCSLSN